MSDIIGHLVDALSDWQIPAYAQEMLWVQQGGNTVQAAGPRGEFSLAVSEPGPMQVAWGADDGPVILVTDLTTDDAPPEIHWQGTVNVGGFIERLHVLETHGLELVIAEIEGRLLARDYPRLPSLAQMHEKAFSRSADYPAQTLDFMYTVLAQADSIQAEYLHHAMVSELAVDCFTSLGPQEGQWHEIVGLPLLLNSVSVLAPGYRHR